MAAFQDPNLSDDENPMPSERSTAPSINAVNRDDILLPPGSTRKFIQNNHRLNYEMRSPHPVIMEIIKGHPLRFAFTLERRVPAFYLQQFWHTLEYHPAGDAPFFTVQIDDYVSRITTSRLRRVLQLPAKDAFPGLNEFEDPVSEADLCRDIRALGYSKELTSIGQFKRMYLPHIYFTLFSIINRCLTGKHTGMDKASTAVLRIFHGMVYNRHYDYAALLWVDIVEYAADKVNARNRDFVPFQRFFQLLIHGMMQSRCEIPRRAGTPLGPTWTQQYLKYNRGLSLHPALTRSLSRPR